MLPFLAHTRPHKQSSPCGLEPGTSETLTFDTYLGGARGRPCLSGEKGARPEAWWGRGRRGSRYPEGAGTGEQRQSSGEHPRGAGAPVRSSAPPRASAHLAVGPQTHHQCLHLMAATPSETPALGLP